MSVQEFVEDLDVAEAFFPGYSFEERQKILETVDVYNFYNSTFESTYKRKKQSQTIENLRENKRETALSQVDNIITNVNNQISNMIFHLLTELEETESTYKGQKIFNKKLTHIVLNGMQQIQKL